MNPSINTKKKSPPSARIAGAIVVFAVLSAGLIYASAHRAGKAPAASEELASVTRAQLEKREGRFQLVDAASPFSGWMLDTYEDGSVKLRTAVVAGQIHGVSEGWHTNGVMELREYFERGVPQGTRTTWYPDGLKRSEGRLVAGLQQGSFRQWHANAALAAEVEFIDGKAQGIARAWYPSGWLKTEALMTNGVVVVRHYYPDGERHEPTLVAGISTSPATIAPPR